MLKVVLVEKGVAQKELFFDADEVFIGRTANNGIMLAKPNVSKRHAVIQVKDGHVVVNDMKSTNGTWVGGRKIDQPQQLKEKDFIFIGDYAISVAIVDPDATAITEEPSREAPVEPQPATIAMQAMGKGAAQAVELPPDLVPPPLPEDSVLDVIPAIVEVEPPPQPAQPTVDVEFEVEVEMEPPAPAPVSPPPPAPVEPPKPEPPARAPAKSAKPVAQKAPVVEPAPQEPPAQSASGVAGLARRLGYGAQTDRFAAMRALAEVAGREVFASVDPGKADFSDAEWLKLSDAVMRLVDKLRRDNRISSDVDPVEMTQQILYEFAGLGPLEELLGSQTVRAIIVNGLSSIQVIDCGGSRTIDTVFSNENTFTRVVTKLCILAGMTPGSKDDPMVQGHLPDGSLLQILGRPYVQEGRMIVIERPVSRTLSPEELVSAAGASTDVVAALQDAVAKRRNIVVCGAPYTARCVFVNSLTTMVGPDRRVLVLGGGPEFELKMPNLVAMNRAAVADSAFGCAGLVGRLFPDHIVVTRVESSDATLLRELGLAGFEGMILGMVANSAEDCVARLRLMLQFSAPGVDAATVDALTARLAETIVVLTLREDGQTVICAVHDNNARNNLVFPSSCQWLPTYQCATPALPCETELTVESPTGPATDPGLTPVEAAIEVQSE